MWASIWIFISVHNFIKTILTLSLLLFWAALAAQTSFSSIQNISIEDFDFPAVTTANKKVDEKINIHLQLSELDLIKGHEKKNIFEKVTFNNGTIYGGKVFITYDVLQNTDRNLAIKFTESSCGATCAYWVQYYNFNPQNGDRYFTQDFFTPEDLKRFQLIIIPRRKEKIQKQIQELLAAGEELEQLNDYIHIAIEEDDLDDFYFTNDSIFFDNENLLNKHDKAWDLDHITGFSIAEIKHLLNPFGQAALLTGTGLENYQSTIEPQLYEGKIGSAAEFYLLFRNDYEKSYSGTYAYKKYGKAINLYGKETNGKYELKEQNDNFDDVATITFQKEKSTLSGFWTNNKNKKLVFTATRK